MTISAAPGACGVVFDSPISVAEAANLMSDGEKDVVALVPGRTCGDCSLCCKLVGIDELHKPAGSWCPHCDPGNGRCTIYADRPAECRSFYCSWLISPNLGPEWRPTKCKMVLYVEGERNVLAVRVDPGDPGAWRRDPYYRQLKEFAIKEADGRYRVLVYVNNRVIVILPNKDVDVGVMKPGDQLLVRETGGPNGRDWEAVVESSQGSRA
jgi:uncharacterized cysteine cluster protein YcgN (CxxCxxCC family)